jgi:predicted ArsR family transcriptional regulator
LHVTTARFHLDALCEEGAIARIRIKRSGVGRPRTGYVAVRDRLDYRSLSEVLALELGDTVGERRYRAERAGERWAARIMASESPENTRPQDNPASDDTDRAADNRAEKITQIFDRMGFGPELAPAVECPEGRREQKIRLYGCPVRDLARTHPEVSCGMHLGLLRGLLATGTDGGAGATLHAELEPFVESELCIAKVLSDD